MLVGWQTVIFLREGDWQALPLSLVFSTPKNTDGEVYSTASIDKPVTTFADTVLQVPIITVLLLATAFLTAFYLWLYSIEKRLTKT
jgi:hypothetical protein